MKRTLNRSGVIHAPENDTETIKLIISGSRIRGMKPGLKKFKEYISRNNYFWDEHTRKFVEYIVTLSQKNTLLFEHDYLIDDVYHISRHHQDRVRDISTWINTIKDDPEKQIKALAKHMFDEHGDVPEFMYKY